jgi:hypothetical protein
MIKFSFLFLLLAALICFSSLMCASTKKISKAKFHVTGSIMETRSYCGGAQPTQEMLERYKIPTGIPFGKLFVKQGTMNNENAESIDTINADVNGNFSINLPAGNYCLVEEWKSKPFHLPLNNKNQTVDTACYRNLYNTCDYELNVADTNIDSIKIIFHRTCFYNQPCISYHGPLPPTTQPH